MNDYIIVANGKFLVREIITDAIQNKIIVALDGAANKLKRINIKPHIILGDFDSIDADTQSYWGILKTFTELTNDAQPYMGKQGVMIVPAKDQEQTDLVKAIHYCDKQKATSITIICATGGREDHAEGVKIALRTEYRPDRLLILHTEQQSLRGAQDETITIDGQIGDHCGFIATHTGTGSSTGLQYECLCHKESICNRLKTPSALLSIKGYALIIMPPQLSSQRAFMQKNDVARLTLQLRDALPKVTGH